MSNEKHETIADIVADIRAQNQGLPEDSYALSPLVCDLLSLADRIEAAHQREVAELKSKMNDVVCENEALRDACETCGVKREREATREKSSQVGNAAKMREACENIAEYAKTAALHTDDLHLLGYLNQIERWSESVLSSPPRNCDVWTAEEQNRRFCKWCRKYGIDGDMEVACAHQDMSCTLCALRWAQMPYEEG